MSTLSMVINMAYSFKGNISFGLVYIPITLHASAKTNDIGFNMIDKKTMSRIKYKKTCNECNGREVKNEDIVKGYEYEKDKYVIFDDNDFEKIRTKKDKNIIIEQFVKLEEIDPIYYDKCYYISPIGGEKAFALLITALESENKVGIAKCILGNKEALVSIRAQKGQLFLNTLHFAEQIQKNPAGKSEESTSAKELKLAKEIIKSMTSKFNIKNYEDEYRKRVLSAIERKINGKQVIKAKEQKETKIVNLMDALQASLKNNKTKKSNIRIPKQEKMNKQNQHSEIVSKINYRLFIIFIFISF